MRTKIVALLLSLFALWAFAAYVTLREGLNLLAVSQLDSGVSQPSEQLVLELQEERRLTLVYLGKPGPPQREALDAQRERTDEAAADFASKATTGGVRALASSELEQRIDAVSDRLAELGESRREIDARGGVARAVAADRFTTTVAAVQHLFDALATLDDKELAKDIRMLIGLDRSRELISQEDALVAGALAAGRLTASERERVDQIVGAHRFYAELAGAELPEKDRARYDDLVNGSSFAILRGLEERLAEAADGTTGGVDPGEWDAALKPVLTQYREVIVVGGDDIVARAIPVSVGVVVRLVLAGGLGLGALVASIIMSITTARALVRQLERLRTAAWDLANERLPGVVERLRQGEKVDVAAESPPLTFGGDEIGQVGQAINAVQETAIRVAVEQAELRNGVRDLFLGLARRNQALVHRQLKVLDEIERRETDAHELADLFKVDHLATRMRRNAENLIVLSGSVPGRRWRNPVPFVDVVRGAVAEVEDYTRVAVLPIDSSSLSGRAVSDVIHLLAELIENAASFSPPYTMVNVGGQKVANGFVVEIEDRGLGMSESELAAANELVRHPPEFNLSSTARLGLYVVGRLAERHSIDVQLRRSPYGGTMAIVLIPATLVVAEPEPSEPEEVAPSTAEGAEPARRVRTYQSLRATQDTEPPAPDAEVAPVTPISPAPVSPAPVIARVRVAPQPEPQPEPHPGPQPAAPVTLTPSGLPWRVRQASLAAPLRESPPPGDEDVEPPATRTPDQTRSMMAAYQSATRRGRAEAERQLSTPPGSADPDGDPQKEDN
ncbi:sensor histidine kinase [Phytohabitans rumicis]|uniref:sensor histidine kinase n=1 Tax=Phytohabitans rumicis TaxID=1076125 RepID=UPI002483938E|nr:nitrate- and nitrite sensing domain-containing protein [Phytohabitans rumicis]